MEELNQFLNSVEASARRILKQQHKKQQELAVRDRVALARAGSRSSAKYAAAASSSPTKETHGVSRDELQSSYSSLIVAAPSPSQQQQRSVGSPAGRRSEHASEANSPDYDDALLPRLPPQSSTTSESRRTNNGSSNALLPSLERSQQQQHKKDAAAHAVDAAKRANRERRTSSKILASPLYKSLAKSKSDAAAPGFGSPQALKKALRDVDHVSILLRKMGLRAGAGSPSQRPDHAVERRMCNACWATPNKLTGCEHHNRVAPAATGSHDAIVRSLELQGPKSWLSDDLFVKYRSETDREALWTAFLQLQEVAQRAAQAAELDALAFSPDSSNPATSPSSPIAVLPVMTRHPIVATFYTHLELENLRALAETRRRNQLKSFVFDVNHLWLTNLDHFNARGLRPTTKGQQHSRQRTPVQAHMLSVSNNDDDSNTPEAHDDTNSNSEADDEETNALRDRRDDAAIAQGYSQIQSISTARALQHAVFDRAPSFVATPSTPSTPSNARPQLRSLHWKRPKPNVLPLSLFVCGRWHCDASPNALDSVPGVTLTGVRRVLWRQRHLLDTNNSDSDDLTKAVAMYTRDAALSSSNAILVSLVLALDAPTLAPQCFAWHVGSCASPVLLTSSITHLHTPQRVSHCTASLVQSPLQSRLDALLPQTIVLLNTAAHLSDHTLALDEPFGHRRLWSEFDRDAFRQTWLVHDTLAPDYDVTPQPCSVLAAQPNATGVCGRFCWHAPEPQRALLTRHRVARDFIGVALNSRTSGSNSPMYIAVSMAHEAMAGVHAAKLTAYLEQRAAQQRQRDYEAKLVEIEQKLEIGRLALEAKRQEQKRIEQELAAATARKLDAVQRGSSGKRSGKRQSSSKSASDVESALREWDARLHESVVRDEQGDWQLREITADGSLVVFYHSTNVHLPPLHRFAWTRPADWRERHEANGTSDTDTDAGDALTDQSDDDDASSSDSNAEDNDNDALTSEQSEADAAVAQLTRALLADEQFVGILKDKLGLVALEAAVRDQTIATALQSKPQHSRRAAGDEDDDDDDSALQLDWDDQMTALTEESDRARASLMASSMAKLQLRALPHRAANRPATPGEGWRRLKASRLPRNFARSVYASRTEGPRSLFINEPNHATPVGMLDPAEASAYEVREFVPELRALVIPKASADLQEKKVIWAEYLRLRPGVSSVGGGTASASGSAAPLPLLEDLLAGDATEPQASMPERVSKAVLCARSNNLEGLENALDSGVDVNARDDYGNSLFMLVCQQGNKRLAKLLLRRRADMNLQNMNGNTALHYLYEYKHVELAEYLKVHGAVDTIANASGLTCYEGLSAEALDAQ